LWAGDFADAEAETDALSEPLVVEDEVVGILYKRKLAEHLLAERPVAVCYRGLHTEDKVFKGGQQAAEDLVVERPFETKRGRQRARVTGPPARKVTP